MSDLRAALSSDDRAYPPARLRQPGHLLVAAAGLAARRRVAAAAAR